MPPSEDAAVRPALLLALRNVPTSHAGESLHKLAGSWVSRNRYYSGAFQSALVDCESQFVQQLFDEPANEAFESG